jgi:hypothetical protein
MPANASHSTGPNSIPRRDDDGSEAPPVRPAPHDYGSSTLHRPAVALIMIAIAMVCGTIFSLCCILLADALGVL